MSERLRPRDLAFLAARDPVDAHGTTRRWRSSTPASPAFDYDRLLELIEDRISFVPRYRQRVQAVPGRLANPVWVDDEDFDLGYHVRRSALPRPGSLDQLRELVARIISRPLDRHRPLWEMYFVEGLAERPGRAALEVAPGAGRRRRHRRPRPGAARQSPPSPRSSAATSGARGRASRRWALVADAVRDSVSGTGTVVDTRAQPHRRGAARRRRRAASAPAASSTGSPGGTRRAESPITGDALAAAPVRDRAHRPRGLPQGPRGPRRHRQRRRAGHRHRGAARLADGPPRVDAAGCARSGPSCRSR